MFCLVNNTECKQNFCLLVKNLYTFKELKFTDKDHHLSNTNPCGLSEEHKHEWNMMTSAGPTPAPLLL